MKMTVLTGVVFLSVCATSAQAFAGAGKLAREFMEAVVKKGGDKAARELAEFGGERAVRETLERAVREGGEELAQTLVRYGDSYGVSAFRQIAKNPKVCINALDALPPSLKRTAVHALERNGDEIVDLIIKYGPEALEVSARHSGVGEIAVRKLGSDIVPVARELAEDQFMRATRYFDDIAVSSDWARRTTLETLSRYPLGVLNALEKHPNVLKVAGSVSVALAYKDGMIGLVDEGRKDLFQVLGAAMGTEPGPGGTRRPGHGIRWAIPAAMVILASGAAASWMIRARRQSAFDMPRRQPDTDETSQNARPE